MKKISLLALVFGLVVMAKVSVFANDYTTSSATFQSFLYVSTATDPSLPGGQTRDGTKPSGTTDLSRVYLSTGYNGTPYLVCIDTFSLSWQNGTAYATNFTGYTNDQFLFPPIPFLPSTATVTGLPLVLDLRDAQGGGRTIRNGLTCAIQGTDGNKYLYTLETVETPSTHERR